jgi:hypothetical protein
MSNESKCQICGAELKSEEEYAAEKHSSALPWYPSRWQRICSTKCQEKAIGFNACWSLKEKLRNMPAMPFETFNAHFGFGLDGDYAEKKYQLMRTDPLRFMFSLDLENFKKLMSLKL